MPLIINNTGRAAKGALRTVNRALAWIPIGDLSGLDEIRLYRDVADYEWAPPDWVNKTRGIQTFGFYSGKTKDFPSTIALFLDSLYFPLLTIHKVHPCTTLYFARALAHEVGHHLIVTRGFVFAPGEKISGVFGEEYADRYAHEIVAKMKLKWIYRWAAKRLKFASEYFFYAGQQRMRQGDSKFGLESLYKAWILDPENLQYHQVLSQMIRETDKDLDNRIRHLNRHGYS